MEGCRGGCLCRSGCAGAERAPPPSPFRRSAEQIVRSSRRASWSTNSTRKPWRGPTPPSTPGGRPTGSTSATWSSAMTSTGSSRNTPRKLGFSSQRLAWTRYVSHRGLRVRIQLSCLQSYVLYEYTSLLLMCCSSDIKRIPSMSGRWVCKWGNWRKGTSVSSLVLLFWLTRQLNSLEDLTFMLKCVCTAHYIRD